MRKIVMLGLLFGAIVLTACATMNIGAYRDGQIDFGRYHSWRWAAADALPVGDARLDHNAFFRDRLEGAVDRELAARGLTQAFTGTADLAVHFHINVAQRFDASAMEAERGSCIALDCRPRVVSYEAGTLVLDVVDARTDRLVWRGWAQDGIAGVFDDQARMDRYVDNAVRKMMLRFPVGVGFE